MIIISNSEGNIATKVIVVFGIRINYIVDGNTVAAINDAVVNNLYRKGLLLRPFATFICNWVWDNTDAIRVGSSYVYIKEIGIWVWADNRLIQGDRYNL